MPGLRREEVALLAQVSVDYYGRLERGNLRGVSDGILRSIVRALRLTDDEEQHLRHLIQTSDGPVRPQRRRGHAAIRPSIQRMLDALVGLPAFIQNGRMDLVAANHLGRALYNDLFDTPTHPPNYARFVFLDPRSRQFAPDWERSAEDVVSILRAEVGRDPYDRRLSDLIGELSTRSDEFRTRWAAGNVVQHRSGTKRFHHSAIGDLTLDFEITALESESPLTMAVFSADPGTPSHDGLELLANWAASVDEDRIQNHKIER